MKKIKLLIGIVLCTLSLNQVKAQSAFSIGPMIGFGHSGVSNTNNMDAQFKPSWQVGLTATYSNQSHLGYGFDILYSMEGGKYSGNLSEYKSDLGYLRIPLRVGYYFGAVDGRFRPKITLGPTIGFLVNPRHELTVGSLTNKGTINDNDVNKFDIGLQLEAGFNYKLTDNLWLNTSIGYYQGFIDVFTTPNSGTNLNNNLGLKVGVAFGL